MPATENVISERLNRIKKNQSKLLYYEISFSLKLFSYWLDLKHAVITEIRNEMQNKIEGYTFCYHTMRSNVNQNMGKSISNHSRRRIWHIFRALLLYYHIFYIIFFVLFYIFIHILYLYYDDNLLLILHVIKYSVK